MGPKRKQANAAIKSPAKKKRVEKEKSAEATPETVTKSENKDLKDLKTPAAKLKIYEPPVPMEPFSFSLSCFPVAVAHSSYVVFRMPSCSSSYKASQDPRVFLCR